MGCWPDLCMHWANTGLRSCGTHPNRQKQTPQRPDHVPPHCGSRLPKVSASLPAEVSHVVKNQLHIAGLHVRVAETSALDCEHGTPPASPAAPWGAPAGEALDFLPSSPRVSGMPREAHPAAPSPGCQPLLEAFSHPPRCSHDLTIQGGVNTSRKFRKCRAPGLVLGLQKHPSFSRTHPCSLNFDAYESTVWWVLSTHLLFHSQRFSRPDVESGMISLLCRGAGWG